MAIGNGLVAVSQKGLAGPVEEASSVERLSIREAGIRSLIRQRITWDSQAAAARPRAYHTDSHIVRLEQERAAGEKLSTSEDQETKPAGQQQSRLHTELHMPSTPDLEPELTSSVAADMTGCSAEDCTASDGGRDNSEVQDARCGGCHMDGMPKLLKRPEVLQTPIEDQVATSIGRAGNRDGFKVVVSSRLRAAAPNYAGAVQPQQQQLAGSMSHAQLAMPFSHLLCLWAIKLVLPHPVTQKVLKLGIPDPPVFDQVRTAEARLGRQACSMQD